MTPDCNGYLPLAPATLHILLSLAGRNLHGYGIMLEVATQSEGRYKLGPGTLYDNLQRLTKQGMITEREAGAGDDPRRRYYGLTSLGRAVLAAEVDRLETVVVEARARLSPLRAQR